MHTIKADNVNEALSKGLKHLLSDGIEEISRNGPVLVAPGPVCIEYTNPRKRVLFSPTRDANHVFHFMEFLWFMSGSNELEFPMFFNSTYGQFSDDGKTMWDAYGHRWKTFFGYDQLEPIITELKNNPTSRRCVLSMWNAWPHAGDYDQNHTDQPFGTDLRDHDLHVATHGGKAVPCNTHAYFAIRDGKLNMTVMNRSNDAIWGCFGANMVHFSFLLEYMAMRIGVPVGSYYQFTNNLHTYTDKFSIEKLNIIEDECHTAVLDNQGEADYRDWAGVQPGYAIEPGFDEDLALFMPWALDIIRATNVSHVADDTGREIGIQIAFSKALNVPPCKTPFFHAVAVPMFLFWVYRKWKDTYSSDICLAGIDAPDWHFAINEWVERRRK